MCECDRCHLLHAATIKRTNKITNKREECKCQANFYKQNNINTTINIYKNNINSKEIKRKVLSTNFEQNAYRNKYNNVKQQYATPTALHEPFVPREYHIGNT